MLTLESGGLLKYHPSKTPAECARDARLSGADRDRTELGLSAGLLLLLGLLAVAAGSRRDRSADREAGRSTYLTGPTGGSAFAEAAAGLGVKEEPYRRPTATLAPPD